jgi:DNA-binding protein
MDFLSLKSLPKKTAPAVINIRQSGKIRNYVRFVTKHLQIEKTTGIPCIINGKSKTISMAITVAEIIKRTFADSSSNGPILHQYNNISNDETTSPCIKIVLGWTKESVLSVVENNDCQVNTFAIKNPGYQSPNDAAAGCEFLIL